MIRDRNLTRYMTHLQQIKVLKRLLLGRIPQLVLSTQSQVLIMSLTLGIAPGAGGGIPADL